MHIAGGPAYSDLQPKKELTFAFLNLPGLQKTGRNRFSDKSCWVIKVGHLRVWVETNKFMNNL